jgi:hypothetical protein
MFLTLAASFALAFANPVAAGSAPDLSGRWQLNEKESEDPKAKFRPREPSERPGQRDREPDEEAARRRAEEAQRRRRGNVEPPKLEAPAGLGEFLEPPRTLTIAKRDGDLTIDSGSGRVFRLSANGAERKEAAADQKEGTAEPKATPVSISSRWDGPSLVVTKTNAEGARLMTRYNLLAGGKKLEVYARMSGTDGHAVTLRRVYDRAE